MTRGNDNGKRENDEGIDDDMLKDDTVKISSIVSLILMLLARSTHPMVSRLMRLVSMTVLRAVEGLDY